MTKWSANVSVFLALSAAGVVAYLASIRPWQLQIGIGRAGWCSYDLVDNLGRPSARRILSEYQNPKPDDQVPMSPIREMGVYVREFDWAHGCYGMTGAGARPHGFGGP